MIDINWYITAVDAGYPDESDKSDEAPMPHYDNLPPVTDEDLLLYEECGDEPGAYFTH